MTIEKYEDILTMLVRFIQATSEFEKSLKDLPADKENVKHELVFLVRNGNALILFSYLESEAKSLCREIVKFDSAKVMLNCLRGNLLARLKIFLGQFLDSEIEFKKYDCWQILDDFAALRHCMVHNNGCLNGFEDRGGRLRRYVESDSGLSLTEDHFILIEEAYLKEMAEVVRRFFEGVYSRFSSEDFPC